MRRYSEMKNKIILTILILSVIALIFSGCVGGSVTPPMPDNTDDSEISEPEVCNLPTYLINVKMDTSSESYFIIELKNVGSGYDIYDGNWTGWCADKETYIESNEWYQGYIYCSYNPPDLYNIDWPKINWIINNKGSYSAEYIQDAIWHFTNGYAPNGLAMAAEAHSDFRPQSGQKYIAIIDVPVKQLTFIEVPYEPFGEVIYRLLIVGISDYSDDDYHISWPLPSAISINELYSHHKYEFVYNVCLKNNEATRSNIFAVIDNELAAKADPNDISYFYFAGHSTSSLGSCILLCYDVPNYINVDELADRLGKIKGTVIVLLDACYAGAFIGKENVKYEFTPEEFNENVINAFSGQFTRDNLCHPKFQVLTSCRSNQESTGTDYPFGDDYDYGFFTANYRAGCGYDDFCYPCPANTDSNPAVSLHEVYVYIKDNVPYVPFVVDQDVQIYPYGSDFPVMEY